MEKEEVGFLIFLLVNSGIVLVVLFFTQFLPAPKFSNNYNFSNLVGVSTLNLIAGIISLALGIALNIKVKKQ